MIKNILKSLIFVSLISSLSVAGDIGEENVDKYEVTINSLELYNSTTDTWVMMANTPKAVNIASATAGADVASMVSSDTQVPFGTFTKGRVTFSDVFTVNACIAAGNCTDGTTSTPGGGFGTTTIADTGAANGIDTVLEVDFPAVGGCTTATSTSCALETTFTTPLVIDETTTSMEVRIAFDIDDVLTNQAGGAISLDFPGIDVTVN